jgi:hypothetical protein
MKITTYIILRCLGGHLAISIWGGSEAQISGEDLCPVPEPVEGHVSIGADSVLRFGWPALQDRPMVPRFSGFSIQRSTDLGGTRYRLFSTLLAAGGCEYLCRQTRALLASRNGAAACPACMASTHRGSMANRQTAPETISALTCCAAHGRCTPPSTEPA